MDIWTTEEEARHLKARFEKINRAKFARDQHLRGGQAMIYQHINAVRPISLEAALIYARGLGVTLADISPRLAQELNSAVKQVSIDPSSEKTDSFSTHTAGKVGVANDAAPYLIEVRRVTLHLSAETVGFATDLISDDDQPLAFRKSWFKKNNYSPEKLVAIKIKDKSMEPALYAGDTVIINTADKTPSDGEVFAVNYEGEAVVKRLVRDNGQWWLFSDNPDQRKYRKKICQGDACLIVGKVIYKQSERI
ncbi:S24 family peptidase [Undibacterium jejuense]|nr:S24 family peptidase [Undibacterium jejuense]